MRLSGISQRTRLLTATYLKVFSVRALEEGVSGGGEERDNSKE